MRLDVQIGNRYGHLTVLKNLGRQGHIKIECKCDCGNIVVLRESHLYKSRRFCSRSCPLQNRKDDLTGKKFSRWTVIKSAGRYGKSPIWECICECGTKRNLRSASLKYGMSKSCGCSSKSIRTEDEIREAHRIASRKSAHKNPARMKANKIKYEKKLSKATPKWLTKEHWEEMNSFYVEARRLTKLGVPHQVDHIVPLNGDRVSGLHVPWNLQILTKSENVSKSNRYAEL